MFVVGWRGYELRGLSAEAADEAWRAARRRGEEDPYFRYEAPAPAAG